MPQNNEEDIVPVPVINPDFGQAVDFTIPDYPRITNRFRAAVKKVLKELGLYEDPTPIDDSSQDDVRPGK